MPVLEWLAGYRHPTPDIFMMLRTALFGCISFLAICAVFCSSANAWQQNGTIHLHPDMGLTFYPTLLCSIAVAFSETFFTVFWNNSIWGMLLGIVFAGILIWKTILYVIFLREVAGLKGGRMAGAFLVIGIIIYALAVLNGYMGVKTPVL